MDTLLNPIYRLLDIIFYSVVSPLAGLLGRGLELVLLTPMQWLRISPLLQVVCIAVLAATLSLWLRRVMRVEEKEENFRSLFLAKKSRQENLHLISDWKSREKFTKAMDDDIDEDFNTYLAGRFARYGIVYLLPLFLTLYWLENTPLYSTGGLPLPMFGMDKIPMLPVFLTAYALSLFLFFRIRKTVAARKKEAHQAEPSPRCPC